MCKKVDACFEELENPFAVLNSEYKWSHFLSDKWENVEPAEYNWLKIWHKEK